ncbi:MAG: hypothetical protein AAFR14_09770 [Bacteroidota bacterium]
MKHRNLIFLLGFGLIGMLSTLTSCTDTQDEFDDLTVENFVDRTIFDFQAFGKFGRRGCYEFVFPISVTLGDGSVVEVEDYAALRLAIAEYIVDNQDTTLSRPRLVYPVDVVSDDGEIVTIEGADEIAPLRRACRRDFLDRVRERIQSRKERCFTLVYPVSVQFADGSTLDAESRRALQLGIRAWRANNPDSDRPMLIYPVTVELEDGSTVELESRTAFSELRESCAE